MSIKFYCFKLFTALLILFLPGLASAGMPTYFDLPDSGYLSNTVIDIIEHNGAIWMATGEGVNYSLDGGQTWLTYDEANGLPSSSISAMFSIPTASGQRIWVASNHEEWIADANIGISDGLSYSDDNGINWTQIDFESAPNDIPYVWGGNRTVFDISGHYDNSNPAFDNWLFFTAFAGGFLASKDGGMNWRRIYPSRSDSIQFNTPNTQPSLRNRYFSCKVDSTHGDSIFVWAGTAGGLIQYIFAEPKDKPFSKKYNDIIISQVDSSLILYGGGKGFTRGAVKGSPFVSKFESDGLPGEEVTAMLEFGGLLFVGTTDPDFTVSSSGLAVSNDMGESFTTHSLSGVGHTDRQIKEFAVMNDRIYMAADEAGLFVSSDTGTTWNHIFVDSSDMTVNNRRNNILTIEAWGDTLNIGTDSGLVRLFMDPTGNIDSSWFHVFAEDNNSSTKVVKVKTQMFQGTEILWTANVPLDINLFPTPIVGRSDDGGLTFDGLFEFNDPNYDINFWGDTAFVVGADGAFISTDGTNPISWPYSIKEFAGEILIDSLNADTITVMRVKGDTVVFGSKNGFAISVDRGESYNIFRVNQDSLAADAVLSYTSSIFGIAGDWIPAMGIQHETSDPFARIWISTRPTFGGLNGISMGFNIEAVFIDTTVNPPDTTFSHYERFWSQVHDNFAWNFAFNGDTVFAATDDGLIFAEGDSLLDPNQVGYDWKTIDLTDAQGFPLVLPGTPVYGVSLVDTVLWVGTNDRTISINLNDFSEQVPFYVIDSTSSSDEVYAFPVPYSHVQDQVVEFRFVLENEADVTLEIYDFAMNLVRRVIDNEHFDTGFYPTAGFGRRTWDGTNGNGEKVAIGVYYFKVELSTGDIHWGKLAVIP